MRSMLTTLFVVLPVFALIFSGWGAFRLKILGPHAIAELNRFVVYLALPALLFDIMANTHGSELWQLGFIAVFLLSSAIAFALPFLVRLRGKMPLADTALDGLNAAYPNTGYMGIPLSMIAFGSGVLAATTISIIITVCVTFAFAIVLIEIGLQTEKATPSHLEGRAIPDPQSAACRSSAWCRGVLSGTRDPRPGGNLPQYARRCRIALRARGPWPVPRPAAQDRT